jgi:hypothetical protein
MSISEKNIETLPKHKKLASPSLKFYQQMAAFDF